MLTTESKPRKNDQNWSIVEERERKPGSNETMSQHSGFVICEI